MSEEQEAARRALQESMDLRDQGAHGRLSSPTDIDERAGDCRASLVL